MAHSIRLLYSSKASVGPKTDLAVMVADIVARSAVNNAMLHVTGLLLHHDGYFIQALEGPQHAVERTYQRVANDRRHGNLKVLGRQVIVERLFGRWAMCARTLSQADDEITKVLALRGSFQPFEMSEAAGLKLLTTVAAIHARQAAA